MNGKNWFLTLLCLLLQINAGLRASNTARLLDTAWSFRQQGAAAWMPAHVPGTVHTDLLNNKLIQDPFLGMCEADLQWIGDTTWEYTMSFDCSDNERASQHQSLLFEGLDTYAKVWFNDSLILVADNMFRAWEVGVTGHLKLHNQLRVVFEPASKRGKDEASKLSYTLSKEERVFTRKAQYQYGWDWGPKYITCGLWKSVKLLTWQGARMNSVQVLQDHLSDSIALLNFACHLECETDGLYFLKILPSDSSLAPIEQACFLKSGLNTVVVPYSIKNPERWWCNGMGAQRMYRFQVQLKYADVLKDERELSIGLRELELVRVPDAMGTSFYFKLNGLPVFMKGANWVPADNFVPRVSDDKYAALLKDAKAANMNMLRVWGGGVYEQDVFYNLCDEYGLLVWQDFMFACAMYPGDSAFMSNVKQELMQHVIRLRNHPSLALWCGNNEIAEGWNNWGWQKEYELTSTDSTTINRDYEHLFNGLIPEVLTELDPARPYIASSPELGWGRAESIKRGDSHYWGVWWGMEPFENYKEKTGRFVSEYGFQGMPNKSTLQRCCGDSLLSMNSACLQAHQKNPRGFQTIDEYMLRDYRKPKDFAHYVYVSQVLQAFGMQQAIVSHRLRTPYCMGSLVWQLNDCWPVTSWSLIDSDRHRKAAYYCVKRSFEKVLISSVDKGDEVLVYALQDSRQQMVGELTIQLLDFRGKKELVELKTVPLMPGEVQLVGRFSRQRYAALFADSANLVLSASFNCEGKEYTFAHYFARPKELKLEKPSITIKSLGANVFELQADRLAKDVYVSGEYDFSCSDNYFDLLPGVPHQVRIDSPIKIVTTQLHTVSLFDSYP